MSVQTTTATLKRTVTRKVGPLPAWVWVAVIVAAFLVYRHVRGGGDSGAGGFALPSVRAASANEAAKQAAGEGSGGGGGAGPESGLPPDFLSQLISQQMAGIGELTSALIGTSAQQAAPVQENAPQGAAAQEGPAAAPSGDTSASWTAKPATVQTAAEIGGAEVSAGSSIFRLATGRTGGIDLSDPGIRAAVEGQNAAPSSSQIGSSLVSAGSIFQQATQPQALPSFMTETAPLAQPTTYLRGTGGHVTGD